MSELVGQEEQESTGEDYKNLNVSKLKDIMREQGRPLSGCKQELIDIIMKPFTDKDMEECKEGKCEESESKED